MDCKLNTLLFMGMFFLHLCSHGRAQEAGSSGSSLHSSSPLPDGTVRLRDGFQPYQGRVEIYYSGQWGTICDPGWDTNAATVLCRQLGYSAVRKARITFGAGSGPVYLQGIKCGGYEDNLLGCSNDDLIGSGSCDHSQDVGVICGDGSKQATPAPVEAKDGALRLADGTEIHNGRLEIFYKGEWGTVCKDASDNMTAHVACRQLGFSTADPPDAVPPGGFTGSTLGPILLDHVVCGGTESKLAYCSYGRWGEHDCSHDNDVMLSCKTYTEPEEGAIRLVAGDSEESGQVEIYYQGVWGTVCDDDWTIEDATVVCRQLNYKPARASYSYSYFLDEDSINPVFIDSIECDGYEKRLEDCTHTWRTGARGHAFDVGVTCGAPEKWNPVAYKEDGRVRLDGGTYVHNGRVQIKYQGEWGTVCDQGWNIEAANVVCRQLGYPSADSALPGAFFGEGTGVIMLDQVSCLGDESELAFCNHAKWAVNECDHSQDASVVCVAETPDDATPDGSTRLVGDSAPLEGKVEVHYQGIWGTVCNADWKDVNGDIVCQELGYTMVDPFPNSNINDGKDDSLPIMLSNVKCTGDESRLVDCLNDGWAITDCDHSSDVILTCIQVIPTSKPATTPSIPTTTPSIPASTPTVTTPRPPIPVSVSDNSNKTDGDSSEESGDGESGDGESGDGESGDTGYNEGTVTSNTTGEVSLIWVIVVLILMVPAIIIIFVIGILIKRRRTKKSYTPVDKSAMPMNQRM